MKFLFGAGRPCLDFVRTLRARRDAAVELLCSPDDLAAWIMAAGLLPAPPPAGLGATELAAARAVREAIYGLVAARLAGAPPEAADIDLVNRCAAVPLPAPRLAPSGRSWSPQPAAVLPAVLSLIARDAIDLVTSPALAQVRRCANERCTALFLDSSRPHNRRWCSMDTCGNTAKVQAYRSRHAVMARPPAGGPAPH